MRNAWVLVVALVAALCACSSSSTTGHACITRADGGAMGSCTEFSGATVGCPMGTTAADVCPTAMLAGKCIVVSGSTTTTFFYYAPMTTSSVMTTCMAAGGTFVAP